MTLWPLLAVPLLIGLNAFFVSAEYAVVALRPVQIESLRRRKHGAAASAMEALKANSASAIGTIQVGITMTNLLLGWLGEPAMTALLVRILGPLGQAVPEALFTSFSVAFSFLVVTLLTVVFSELLPKALTLRHAEAAAVFTAVPVFAMSRALRPLVIVMNALANIVTVPLGLGRVDRQEGPRVTAAEIRLLTTEAAKDGVLTPGERSLILNTLSMGSRTARQIMVPRVQVAFLDIRKSMEENRQVMNRRLFSRLLVCDGSIDKVIGVIHTKEFLSAYHAAGDVSVLVLLARPPVFVPEFTPVDRLLAAFQENKSHLLILVDEFGGVAGIVTLRDVVDELLGVSPLPPAGPGLARAWVVPGGTPVHELAQQIGLPEWGVTATAATVGGLLLDALGRVPQINDQVQIGPVSLQVLEVGERTVRKLRVEVRPPATG